MSDPFDRSACSFHVPEFRSEEEEKAWMWSLTPSQRFEIMMLMNFVRFGKEACERRMDRKNLTLEVMTMEEFRRSKGAES